MLRYARIAFEFMNNNPLIGVYCLLLMVAIYLFACADTNDEGVNGAFARLLKKRVPSYFKSIMTRVCGHRVVTCCSDTFDYVTNQRNPILQILYLLIINGAFVCWLIFGVPQLPTYLASTIHIYGGYVGVVVCQVTFYFACTRGPGVLTKENVECFNHYPYDGLLFAEGYRCKTCKVSKVIYVASPDMQLSLLTTFNRICCFSNY